MGIETHTTVTSTKSKPIAAIFLREYIRIAGKRLGAVHCDNTWFEAFKRIAAGDILQAAAFRGNGFGVIVTLDDTERHGVLLHASISLDSRYPTWDEIKDVKLAVFGPDMDVMQVIPKNSDYVNLHPNTFHLWQTPVNWDIG